MGSIFQVVTFIELIIIAINYIYGGNTSNMLLVEFDKVANQFNLLLLGTC